MFLLFLICLLHKVIFNFNLFVGSLVPLKLTEILSNCNLDRVESQLWLIAFIEIKFFVILVKMLSFLSNARKAHSTVNKYFVHNFVPLHISLRM